MTVLLFDPYIPKSEFEYDQIKRAGVTLANGDMESGFYGIEEDLTPDEVADKLWWMDREGFSSILKAIPAKDFGGEDKKNEKLAGLITLHRQSTKEEDGFPERTDNRPLMWPVSPFIPQEIKNLQEKLKEQGVDEVKVGLEIEVSIPEFPGRDNGIWQTRKEEILDDLTIHISNAEGEEKTKLEEKIEAVKEFNAREVMAYELIETNPETKDIFEYLFGKSRSGKGYYDAENKLEFKLNPSSPEEFLKNYRTAVAAIYEKASEYGLTVNTQADHHISFSFWHDGKNIFDPANEEEFEGKGGKIIQGMTRALCDNILSIMPETSRKYGLDGIINCSINRDSAIRYSTGRIEIRNYARPHNDLTPEEIEFILPVIMGGAIDGLKAETREHLSDAGIVDRINCYDSSERFKVTPHVLGNSKINEDGSLGIPSEYIMTKAVVLAEELGIIPKDSKLDYKVNLHGASPVVSA